MPHSDNAGKKWTGMIYMTLRDQGLVKRALDIGAGCGTYACLGRSPDTEWVGIEVWGPYVQQYQLKEKYDQLIVADARYVDYVLLGRFDIAFLGDVLEHMSKPEAVSLFQRVTGICRYVFISIPVVKYPQHALDDNPFEIHRKDDWSNHEVLETFPGICSGVLEGSLGAYLAVPDAQDRPLAVKIATAAKQACYGRGPQAAGEQGTTGSVS